MTNVATGSDTLMGAVNRALAEYNTFGRWGQNWSVSHATSSLIRIGVKPDLDTTPALVWDLPGVTGETLLKTTDGNLIDTVSGSSALDTTHVFDIYGSFFDASGNLVRQPQRVALNGQNKVTLDFPIARVCEVVEIDSDPMVGDFYVYQDTAIVGGVPTDKTKIANFISGSSGQARSQKLSCVTAGDESLLVLGGIFSVNKKQSAFAEFTLQQRHVDSDTWQKAIGSITLNGAGQSSIVVTPMVLGVLPPNHDIHVICESSTTATPVSGTLMGFYAKQKG